MKTGVLVHGCNLNIENWRSVAWGEPPHHLGRIPMGFLVAEEHDASVVVFGTGASRKEFRFGDLTKDRPVLTEADFSLHYLRTHFHQLVQFTEIKQRVNWLCDDRQYSAKRQAFLDRIIADNVSLNTFEEICNAGKIFSEQQIDRVILVSSPSHIVRCLRDASAIYHSDSAFKRFRLNLFASPSITCYEGTSAADVVVVEPPHRPDRHVIPTHRRIQRMMTLQKLPQEQLVSLIEEFDDLLQKYEDIYFSFMNEKQSP